MKRRLFLQGTLAALALSLHDSSRANPSVVLIGHPGMPRLDPATVQRLYTGRSIEVDGNPVTVVQLGTSNALREQFLSTWLQTDEASFRAYWTVRRHIGKGAPPRELPSVNDVIDFVQNTPGGLGYIDAASVRAGMNVVGRH